MGGHGDGAAANDDGSGTTIVMELARILNMPDVQTERSIRFILFNNEETGGGARAYVTQCAPLLNSAQTTLAAVSTLAGATIRK
jgi:Zn-dependent M28 family amino/carboxypeptidase